MTRYEDSGPLANNISPMKYLFRVREMVLCGGCRDQFQCLNCFKVLYRIIPGKEVNEIAELLGLCGRIEQ